MKLNRFAFYLGFSFLFILNSCTTPATDKAHRENTTKPAKNIILMIGDGMSYAQIEGTENAIGKQLAMSKLPVSGTITTHSADKRITDSGAGGTAIATGFKTNNGMIGMKADSTAVPSMLELFAEDGKQTAIVVSCGITHATPASFVAKDINRNNYEAIAKDIAESENLNYFIGGARKHFVDREDNKNLLDEMTAKGWQFFNAFEDAQFNTSNNAAVFTADEHPDAIKDGRSDYLAKGSAKLLETMSKQAEKGFFMMVEGSQIDWAGHANDSAYLVTEMIDFDNAVKAAIDFADRDGETLVVITADHETGGLTIINGREKDYSSVRFNFSTGNHTSVTVPVFAYGPGSEYFTGVYDNTEIFYKILKATGK
ncbi:MAG: alkaline phosphatase [Bacteroidales bacterium]|jgi:alkaline phosphatase|nr:alkaline phosphatase [Bacteroidales bacterium]MDD4087927.1 alkaline phosphatase [Bacteroidales bacterium]MDY0086897.1 alkaline phosphatase [Bacteroidales bacterium]